MNLILILFLTSAYCVVVAKTEYNEDYQFPTQIIFNGEIPDTYTTSTSNKNTVRIKRNVDFTKNSDNSYKINAEKDIISDGTKKLTTFGSIDGLKPGDGYNSLNAGLDFKNDKGNQLTISGLHTKAEDSLSGRGLLNILNTETQSLTAKGLAEKTWNDHDSLTKFAGSLDYLNKNGNKLSLSGLHTYSEDNLSGKGLFNILNTDTQSLTAKGLAEKTWNDHSSLTKFAGSLDYLNKNGHDAFLSAKHDSNLGDAISASGTYSFINSEDHKLNAKGYWNRDIPINKSPVDSYGASLNYLNSRKGNSASILAHHVPDLGDQLSLAGKYNILHNDNHDLHASGMFTRTFPSNSNVGNFNDFSGNLNYLYKDKVGLDFGVKHSDLTQRSDFSALGKLNLINERNKHLDVFGGVQRSISPNFHSPWGSSFGLNFGMDF